MARKLNIISLLQQERGLFQITCRYPRPRIPLSLMPLKPSSKAMTAPRLTIPIDERLVPESPRPVSIILIP
jgi:hypothetical protein